MNITGTTVLMVNGKVTRVCGRRFNAAIKSHNPITIKLETGEVVTPSKGLGWIDVAKLVREGKKVQAAVAGKARKRASDSAPSLEKAAA